MCSRTFRPSAATPSISIPHQFGDSRSAAIETLVPADVTALNQLYYVDSATPVVGRNLLLRYRNIDLDAQVNGVSDLYFQVRGIKMESGIAFSENDADARRRWW